ncbi:ArnT family glycosyltransferase [Herbihabitans rhizosphaerae]|nr:glycosyltransferase family 39 protein [Herbihabitans rhizosphaerae]
MTATGPRARQSPLPAVPPAGVAALPRFASAPIATVVAVQVAILTALSGRYGFHRDELYFVASGNRPAWGYVDNPPITPILAKLSTALFGNTPTGLRVVATVIAAGVVVLVALITRELGGGRAAQVLASVATALSGYVLSNAHWLSTAGVDLLLWLAISLLTLCLLRTRDGRWWIPIGAVIGVGLANKWLVLLLVVAIGVGVLAVGPREVLRSAWLAAGIAIAAVIVAPLLVWQAANDWPMLTVASGISEDDGLENRLMFVPHQLLYLSPVLVPVWIAGLVRLWRDPAMRWARSFAVAYPVLAVIIIAVGGKPYYALPMLVVLLAAGATPTVRWLSRGGRARRASAGVAAAVGVVVSVAVALPVLPPDQVGIAMAITEEPGETVGWQRFTENTAHVWREIPAARRGTAVIFTRNYGQAGAIDMYGHEHGLPRAYSGHMSYADWGPPPDTMTGPVLLIGPDPTTVGRWFTGCRAAGQNDNGLGVDNKEQGTRFTLCDAPTDTWSRLWPSLRHFY